jgi:hypothetical protein
MKNEEKSGIEKVGEKNNQKSTWALVLSIVGIFGFYLLSYVAVVLGIISIQESKKNKGKGMTLATIGLALGILGVIANVGQFLQKNTDFFTSSKTSETISPSYAALKTETSPPPQQVSENVKTSAPQHPKATWKYVASFEGVGMKKLPPFTITGNKWRIKWSCNTTEGQFGFSVTGYSVKGGDTGSEIIRTTCPFSGVDQYEPSPGYGGAGSFYLDVLADEYIESQPGWSTSWKITVEELG